MLKAFWLRSLKSRLPFRCSRHVRRLSGRRILPAALVQLETLEHRVLLSATDLYSELVVTNTHDGGDGSLRQAIEIANADAGTETIVFDIHPLDGGYRPSNDTFVIRPRTPLPTITDAVIIDGYTQPGNFGHPDATPNTLADGNNAVLKIEINGGLLGDGAVGLDIAAGGSTVRGLVISGFSGYGVWLRGGDWNVVAGNFIGTDVTGTVAMANSGGPKIQYNTENGAIVVNSGHNLIGGTDPASRNVLSGNAGAGIVIQDSQLTGKVTGNRVEGNFIGTDRTGAAALGNLNGVVLADGGNTGAATVGGTVAGARNVISGNAGTDPLLGGFGIAVGGVSGTVIQGNFIGTDVTGTNALGNSSDGIKVVGGSDLLIGGTDPGAGNLIAASGAYGVSLVNTSRARAQGNLIGTDVTGTTIVDPDGNLLGNSEGIFVQWGSDALIGGTAAAARNVISGNRTGVDLRTTRARVQGNYIGTDVTGTVALGNYTGVYFGDGSTDNMLGGSAPGAGNVISGNSYGVEMSGPGVSGNQIQGNLIGTAADGLAGTLPGVSRSQSSSVDATSGLGNGEGVTVHHGASANLIGTNGDGTQDAAERNVISGSRSYGVWLWQGGTNDNVVAGNYIGTDATGTTALGNRYGVAVSHGAGHTRVERNVISASDGDGVILEGHNNVLAGNFIGTDAAGLNSMGNGGSGVLIRAVYASSHSNVIGTNGDGVAENTEGNLIAFNGWAGVHVAGSTAAGNSIRGNSIHSNDGLGIDLGLHGVTANDSGDATGGNNLQNFPVLDSVQGGATTRITGTLNSLPDTKFIMDLYANDELDPSGHGEGRRWLGFVTLTTDANGDASFGVTLTAPTASGEYVTATATRLADHDADPNTPLVATDTSEFSATAPVNQPPVAEAGGPYSEGGGIALDASGTTDLDTGDTLSYVWDLDGDGVYGETGTAAGRGDEIGIDPIFSAAGLDGPTSVTVSLRVTDSSGLTSTDTATIAVTNMAPQNVAIAGPTSGVRGQTLHFSSSFVDPGLFDTHVQTWQVLDASNIVVASGSGATFSVILTEAGAYTIRYTVADDDDGTGCDAESLTIRIIEMQGNDLAVGGTTVNDHIVFEPGASAGEILVTINGVTSGPYTPTGRLLAFGQAGDDHLQVASTIELSAWLYGDAGSDRIKGGAGRDALFGGAGDDLLVGGGGRDLLVGGTGADRIVGNADDDILIAGYTAFDYDHSTGLLERNHEAAIAAILLEWASARDYGTRIKNLTDGSGSADRQNGGYFLAAGATVIEDGEKDVLTGCEGYDWFFLDSNLDRATDVDDEVFANDLEFILSEM